MSGHIVAIGGGSLWRGPDPRLDAYILSLAGVERPRVCFLGTATGDAESVRLQFHRAMARHECRPAELTFFEREVEDLAGFVAEQDVFWVGGGSVANLLPPRRAGVRARAGRRAALAARARRAR